MSLESRRDESAPRPWHDQKQRSAGLAGSYVGSSPPPLIAIWP
jgi:hypothetical protein